MALIHSMAEQNAKHISSHDDDGNLINKTDVKSMLKRVRDGLLDSCLKARKMGVTKGGFKKDGTPDKLMKDVEWAYYRGAYECLTRMMAEIEGTDHDTAMKYVPVTVYIAGLRSESIVESLLEDK